MEDMLKMILEGMRKKGMQLQEIKFGDQVLKISLEPETKLQDQSLELSEIDPKDNSNTSFSKTPFLNPTHPKK